MVDFPNRIRDLMNGHEAKPPRWRHGDWMGVEIVRRWLIIQRVVMFAVLALSIFGAWCAWDARAAALRTETAVYLHGR
jgi:hypothetical protein